MRKVIILSAFLFSIGLTAQTSFKNKTIKIKSTATIDLSKVENDYFPALQKLEAPTPNGNSYRDYLEKVKQERLRTCLEAKSENII